MQSDVIDVRQPPGQHRDQANRGEPGTGPWLACIVVQGQPVAEQCDAVNQRGRPENQDDLRAAAAGALPPRLQMSPDGARDAAQDAHHALEATDEKLVDPGDEQWYYADRQEPEDHDQCSAEELLEMAAATVSERKPVLAKKPARAIADPEIGQHQKPDPGGQLDQA